MNKLTDFFAEDELEWRVQSCGISQKGVPWAMALCYVQARAVEKRLDDVFGVLGWKKRYEHVKDKDVLCYISAYDPEKKEWIEKSDGASETDIERFKGGLSASFKRAASSGFGIGRYLYEMEERFAVCQLERPQNRDGWKQCKTKDKKVIYWQAPKIKDEFLPKKGQ